VVELAEVIRGLREELQQAIAAGDGAALRVELGTIELEASVVIESGGQAGAKVQQALRMFLEIGARSEAAEALNHFAEVSASAGDLQQAGEYHGKALRLAREISSPHDEAEALEGLGEVFLLEGNRADGVDHLSQALAIYRRLGIPAAQRVEARLAQHPAYDR
jgi:tetratricopeptide (TPR) repeat protein